MVAKSPQPSVLSVRVSADERRLLAAAADQSRTSLSDFVRRKAIEAAEIDVLERRAVIIAAADWARFERWAAAPAKGFAALRELAETPPAWKD